LHLKFFGSRKKFTAAGDRWASFKAPRNDPEIFLFLYLHATEGEFANTRVAWQPSCSIGDRRIEKIMLWYAWVFLVVAIIAAILGFGGIAGAAMGIAKILFVVFLVLFLISLFAGRRRAI